MAELLYIQPKDLKDHWEYVRQGVARIHEKCKDRWSIEDLYMMLKTERAALYMCMDDKVEGFVVLQLNDDYDEKSVNVFAGYSDTKDIMSYALPMVKDIAIGLNAKRLTFVSPRAGWDKRALELGYTQVSKNYEMTL